MHTNSEISLDVLLSESVSVSPSPSNQSRDQTLWTSGPALSGDLLIDSLQNRCLICHLSLSIRLPGRRSGSSRTAPGAPDCPQRSGLPPALRESGSPQTATITTPACRGSLWQLIGQWAAAHLHESSRDQKQHILKGLKQGNSGRQDLFS